MRSKPKTIRPALVLALWATAGLAAEAPPAAPPPERVEDLALVDQAGLDSERALSDLVLREFEKGGRFGRRQLTELPIRQAALYALRRNLEVQRRYVGEDIARAALREAEAVFNPVLFFAYGYDRSETFTRIQHDRRVQLPTRTQPVGTGNNPNRPAPVLNSEDPEQLDPRRPRLEFINPRGPDKVPARIVASQALQTGATQSHTYDVQIFQQLPWGNNLTLSYQAVDQEKFFVNNTAAFQFNAPQFVRSGSYNRPWLSSFIANLSLPLPGSKDFGPYAEQDVGIKFADLGRERAFWAAESAINATLRDVEVGYWELIRALLGLRITIENRQSFEQLLERTRRLYAMRIATNYDQAQVESELARLRSQEESAWNAYVVASNALVRLLNLEENQLLLPVGYSQALAHALSEGEDLDTLAGRGRLDHPDLAQSAVDLKAARIEQERRAVRTRPDLRLTAQVNAFQSGAFGYKRVEDSFGNTFDPDTFQQTYTLQYLYPWRNQAVKARLNQAEAAATRQQLVLGLTGNRIDREINNARIALASAAEQVKITARNVQLAELVYEKAVAQRELGTVTEYEIVQQNQRLLGARLSQIQARTALKQAEAQLLAALGILPRAYPERTAQTALDRHRLNVLAANHVLRYFGEAHERTP